MALALLWPGSSWAGEFTVFGPERFVRLTAAPQVEHRAFSILNPGAKYFLRITNGAPGLDVNLISSAVITLNGVQVVKPRSFNQSVTTIETAIKPLLQNDLAIEVRSAPGAEITVQIVGVDVDLPSITAIAAPAPNQSGWNNTPVVVSFTCSDSTSTVVCPEPVRVESEGRDQVITGTARDAGGNAATASVDLDIDLTPPAAAIATPPDGTTLHVTTLTASGSVNDALSGVASIACAGVPGAITGDTFTCPIALNEGVNDISVTATDVAGNVFTFHHALTFLRLPSVTITAPQNSSYLNITPTTVTGYVDDPSAKVSVNGIPAAVVNGGFSVAIPLAEGPNILTATATNQADAVGSASIQVTLDTTPPRVTITSPPDGFETTDPCIVVSGIVNDIVVGTVNELEAQVTVNNAPAQVANRTFLTGCVPLALGENIIQAVGIDRVGNAGTMQIKVRRIAPGLEARIRALSGNSQSGMIGSLLPQPLVVVLEDSSGAPVADTNVIFKVAENDGLVAGGGTPAASALVTTDAQGQARVRWTLGGRAGAGSNAVEAYAVGIAGTALFTASGTQGAPGKVVVDSGMDQIGVVGEPLPKPLIAVVVDEGNNRLRGVPVTFKVIEGGGSFAGSPTFTVNTDSDGRAAANLTLGNLEGEGNNVVEVGFPASQGLPIAFKASGRVSGDPAQTTISGVVLDNSNVPIPGVTVRAVLTTALRANMFVLHSVPAIQTDAQGQFVLPGAPVGFSKLMVDGTTATAPGKYPSLEYDMVTVAGRDNTVGMPIYLLPLNPANELCVTPTSGGGALTIPEAPGFSLTFGPGQVTFPGGSKSGCVSVTVVHGDKVPMVPGFGQQPRFIVTIQPAGATFNPPAPITLPNVDGLAPRAVTEMYSFDHDIGSFVAIGTGTVSADGLEIRSDPGVGVLKAGWHCGGDPAAFGYVADCQDCTICKGPVGACVADDTQDGGSCKDDGDQCTDDRCMGGHCQHPLKVESCEREGWETKCTGCCARIFAKPFPPSPDRCEYSGGREICIPLLGCWESQCVCECTGSSPGMDCVRACIRCAHNNGAPATASTELTCKSACGLTFAEQQKIDCCVNQDFNLGGCGCPTLFCANPPLHPNPDNPACTGRPTQ
jgi:hypothetical protein